MTPYFHWWPHKQRSPSPLDQKSAAKMEDRFYEEYGARSIKANVQDALERFAFAEKVEPQRPGWTNLFKKALGV